MNVAIAKRRHLFPSEKILGRRMREHDARGAKALKDESAGSCGACANALIPSGCRSGWCLVFLNTAQNPMNIRADDAIGCPRWECKPPPPTLDEILARTLGGTEE